MSRIVGKIFPVVSSDNGEAPIIQDEAENEVIMNEPETPEIQEPETPEIQEPAPTKKRRNKNAEA